MGSKEIEADVRQLEAAERQQIEELDRIVAGAKSDLASHAAAWLDSGVRDRLGDAPDVAQALGPARLAQMKEKVSALKQRMPVIIGDLLADPRRRPSYHIPLAPDVDPYNVRRDDEAYPTSVFRSAVNHLSPILVEFGLLPEKGQYPSWKPAGGGLYSLSYVSYETAKNPAWRGFDEGVRKLRETQRDLNQRRAELKKTKAQELWD